MPSDSAEQDVAQVMDEQVTLAAVVEKLRDELDAAWRRVDLLQADLSNARMHHTRIPEIIEFLDYVETTALGRIEALTFGGAADAEAGTTQPRMLKSVSVEGIAEPGDRRDETRECDGSLSTDRAAYVSSSVVAPRTSGVELQTRARRR